MGGARFHSLLIMARVLSFFAVALLLQAIVHQPAEAAQMTPDPGNPCKAIFNGTSFDISNVFSYPVRLTDSRNYTYLWSPCGGYECQDQISPPGKDSAVCQLADRWYNCGRARQPIWLLNNWDPYMLNIQYPWGTDWRIAVFSFEVDENQKTPTVEFVSEEPYLQYNFLVKGKCIGQEYCRRGEPHPRDAALKIAKQFNKK